MIFIFIYLFFVDMMGYDIMDIKIFVEKIFKNFVIKCCLKNIWCI